MIQELNFYFNKRIDISKDLLIFDEIQSCPRALTSLKYFNEDMPELALASAGSLLGIQLSNVSFPVGKVEYLNMFPMTFLEFLESIGKIQLHALISGLKAGDTIPETAHSQLWDLLKIYFVVGGLPEAVSAYIANQEVLFTALELVREKQSQIITMYNSDIAKHSGKENSMHIERVWNNIPAQLAKEQDASAHRFRFKGVVPGVI